MITQKDVKELARGKDMNVSKDTYGAIEEETKKIILAGIERAKKNKRKTLMPHDI